MVSGVPSSSCPRRRQSRVLLTASVVLLALLLGPGCREQRPLLLGAGPGLPLLLAEAVARHYGDQARATPSGADLLPRTVADCCAATSAWALSSRELDVAIMCPDAARALVERNADYVLAGPVLLDGEVLVRRAVPTSGGPPQAGADAALCRVGIAHQRSGQRTLVQDILGADAQMMEMLPAALPYALERGVVDAVVLDSLVAVQTPLALRLVPDRGSGPASGLGPDLGFEPIPGPASRASREKGRVSQVLVLHRRLVADSRLVAAFAAAVAEVNAALPTMLRMQTTNQGEEPTWTSPLTRFVSPLVSVSIQREAGRRPRSGAASPLAWSC